MPYLRIRLELCSVPCLAETPASSLEERSYKGTCAARLSLRYTAAAMSQPLPLHRPTQPSKDLVTFKNPAPEHDYTIAFDVPEFTCLCPLTGQPDFAHFKIRYVPDQLCVELKSLKMYMWSFRDEGQFHEAVTNRMLNDLVKLLKPRSVTVEGDFFVRGGIGTVITASYDKKTAKAKSRK